MSAALIHSSVTCIYNSRTDVVMSDLLFFFVYRYKYMFIDIYICDHLINILYRLS